MFLKNYPAMKIGNCLVVADLHIGITKDIYESGILVPLQSEAMANKLNNLGKMTKSRRLVILGDVKHKVPGFSVHEKFELEKFLSCLKFRQVIIVKGNHDGNIEKMIPPQMKGRVKVRKFLVVGDWYLTHGHMNAVTKKKRIAIGHNQPHIRLKDDIGAYYVEPVWLRGRLNGKLEGKKLVIIPAFNELCGATIVNKDAMLGPIAKLLDKARTKVYLLDGTDLGRLSDFMTRKAR